MYNQNKNLNLFNKVSNKWDSTASVRNNPETYDLNLPKNNNLSEIPEWHLPNYSGILKHDELSGITPNQKKFVMGTQLLEFVMKQVRFEIECVNTVAQNIANDKYHFSIPQNLRLDALKIYTDEGFHAYFTQKIAYQIREFYNINEFDLNPYIDIFFKKIEKIGSSFDKKYKYLSLLALVIVGENQIVSDITTEMKNIVFEPIRVMFKEHAIDESMHAKYFALIFDIIWGQLDDTEKEILGSNLCDAMIILGTPRVDIYYYSLGKIGYSKDQISRYISDIYHTKEWKTSKIKDRMSPTINLLNSSGIFKISKVKEKFTTHGLI